MKTVIFSGGEASGKTTRARALQKSISPNYCDHFTLSYGLRRPAETWAKRVLQRKEKTVLLDEPLMEYAEDFAKSLFNGGFTGTFIVTTGEPIPDGYDFGIGVPVTIHRLQTIENILSPPNIKNEAKRLAEKYDGLVLECSERGTRTALQVVFRDSPITVIFKNRNGGTL